MIKEGLLMPYNYAKDINKHFDTSLTEIEFYSLVETLYAVGSERNQKRTADFFKTLTKEEVIRRSNIVSKLNKLLRNINDTSNLPILSR